MTAKKKDEKEKCHWKYQCTGFLFGWLTGHYKTECGKNYNHELVMFGKYCPYCGKEIDAEKPHL